MAETEDKWWMARGPLGERRKDLTPQMLAERRLRTVQERLEADGKRMTAARHNKMSRWLRQWVRGYAFKEMSEQGQVGSLRTWLRNEFVAAVKDAFKGNDLDGIVGAAIRQEVGRILSGARYSSGERDQDRFKEYIQKLVAEEVKKQVMASVNIDVVVKGRVFSPAQGQRRVDLEHQDGD